MTVTGTVTATATISRTVTASRVVTPSASAADRFAAFLGPWSGHTRSLKISDDGFAFESVSDGCCTKEYEMTYQLSDSSGTREHARATATIMTITVFDQTGLPGAPEEGDTGSVRVDDGVLTQPWFGVTYCDEKQSALGTCGAWTSSIDDRASTSAVGPDA